MLIRLKEREVSLSQEIPSDTPASTIPAKKDNESPKDSRQTFIPLVDLQNSTLEWNRAGGIKVVYARGVKRITLQRLIISQIVFEKEKVQLKDLLLLFDNLLYLQELALKDPGFQKKFGNHLERLAIILKNSRLSYTPTRASFDKLSHKFKEELEHFLIPHRNLAEVAKHFKGKYEVRQGTKSGIPVGSLPLKRYIGIGYRDKGTARNLAEDGSPSWQEYCRMRLWENLK